MEVGVFGSCRFVMSTEIGTLLVSTPDVCGGRLRVEGTHTTVNQIVVLYKEGRTAEDIADEHPHLTLAQVYAALSYYHANQDEIEADLLAEREETCVPAKTDTSSQEREIRLAAFRALQRDLSLTPARAADWQEAVLEARR